MKGMVLGEVSGERLDAAAGANLVRHMGWIQGRTPGMRVESDERLTLVDSGLPCDTFNIVCGATIPTELLRDRVERAVGYFESVRRPFSWWVGPADRPCDLDRALEDAGLAAAESETAMAADLHTLAPAASHTGLAQGGLRIERARTPGAIRDFAVVVAANWSPPDPSVLRFYDAATPVLLNPDCPLWLYVGYADEVPVAACELTEGGGVAGLYNVCTPEAHRRRGFGSAMVLRSLLDAREHGYQTAVLQASEGGRGVYARLGFRATGVYTEYQLPIREAA